MKRVRKAQNLVEYILIFALVGVVCFFVASKIDLNKLKNYVFVRPVGSDGKINIEAMTK